MPAKKVFCKCGHAITQHDGHGCKKTNCDCTVNNTELCKQAEEKLNRLEYEVASLAYDVAAITAKLKALAE